MLKRITGRGGEDRMVSTESKDDLATLRKEIDRLDFESDIIEDDVAKNRTKINKITTDLNEARHLLILLHPQLKNTQSAIEEINKLVSNYSAQFKDMDKKIRNLEAFRRAIEDDARRAGLARPEPGPHTDPIGRSREHAASQPDIALHNQEAIQEMRAEIKKLQADLRLTREIAERATMAEEQVDDIDKRMAAIEDEDNLSTHDTTEDDSPHESIGHKILDTVHLVHEGQSQIDEKVMAIARFIIVNWKHADSKEFNELRRIAGSHQIKNE